jgi:hypothetical protein
MKCSCLLAARCGRFGSTCQIPQGTACAGSCTISSSASVIQRCIVARGRFMCAAISSKECPLRRSSSATAWFLRNATLRGDVYEFFTEKPPAYGGRRFLVSRLFGLGVLLSAARGDGRCCCCSLLAAMHSLVCSNSFYVIISHFCVHQRLVRLALAPLSSSKSCRSFI